MARRTIRDIERIWSSVEGIKKLSDRIIGVGPIGFGLDALLTWVPVVGTAYTVGAAAWLLYQAHQARATPGTIAKMVGYLAFDTATGAVPLVGDAVDTLFPGHLMAARALQKEIESTHWVEADEASSRASGEHDRHLDAIRSKPHLRRLVYLHD
jgi:hypothetical protein